MQYPTLGSTEEQATFVMTALTKKLAAASLTPEGTQAYLCLSVLTCMVLLLLLSLDRQLALASITFLADYMRNQTARAEFQNGHHEVF